jgi:hypothetical protein
MGLEVELMDADSECWREIRQLYCLQRVAIRDNERLFESDWVSLPSGDRRWDAGRPNATQLQGGWWRAEGLDFEHRGPTTRTRAPRALLTSQNRRPSNRECLDSNCAQHQCLRSTLDMRS